MHSFYIKKLFLSFLQAYFKNHPKYTWDVDLQKTKIVIGDTFLINDPIIEKKPAIILKRRGYYWEQSSIGQIKKQSLSKHDKTYTDLIRGSVSLNVIHNNGIVAERLGDILLFIFTGFKDELKKHGLHSVKNLQVGEEQILKSASEKELFVVPINIVYETQYNVNYEDGPFYLQVKAKRVPNATEYTLGNPLIDEKDVGIFTYGIDFVVDDDNHKLIKFIEPPKGITLEVTYTDAETLADITEVPVGAVDGFNKNFYVTKDISTDLVEISNYNLTN